MGRLLARKRTADVALMRITTLLDDAPDAAITSRKPTAPREVPPGPRFEKLEVRGLTSLNPSSGQGVRDVSFTLKRGEVTIVTGRVGSGKSTLLKAVIGLLPMQEGDLTWNGEIVDDPATFMTPPRAAYTAQSPRLFTESLRDNILMGLPDDGRVDEAVHLAVLEEDLIQLGNGLDTLVGTRGVTLSGGQVQRSAAARMFARRPELLVFDDASSALDVRTEHTFWERLFASGQQHTCLAVSHRLEAYRRANEIIVLDAGQVVARGSLRDLLRDSAIFREIWHEQTHATAMAHQHAEPAE
jgi:ABC-type multidrug transport system fused ATPase/permease subunit